MKQATISRWKSEHAKQRFHALEQAIWDDAGYPPPEPLDIPTGAGTTRLYRWRGEGDPVVLLHGMGGTGLTWGPYVEGLAGHDVYAVDTIGDVGRSEQTALIADADDLSRWLDETLAGARRRTRPPGRHVVRRLPRAEPRGAIARSASPRSP